jgi:hypothetical protein
MLTTTIDGLWVLQVLSGIETLAPELGLRPHLPSIETRENALRHPVADELRGAGVLSADGCVDGVVLEWMTVLARRDVGLLLYAQTPMAASGTGGVLLARFAQWWVTLERRGELIRLCAAGTASTEESAQVLIGAHVERFCGERTSAPMHPATLDASRLIAAARDRTGLAAHLDTQKLDPDQKSLLMLAADAARSTQASFVATQSGISSLAGPHIGSGAVTVIDTPRGRLTAEHSDRQGKSWVIISPGSTLQVASAIRAMMRRLPASPDWFSYRRVS